MKIFGKFPKKSICPICKTNKGKESVLVAMLGTQKDNICEAELFHLDCLNLVYDKKKGIIYQVIK